MPHFQSGTTTSLDAGSSSCAASPLPQDGEMELSCSPVLQLAWGDPAHLVPWSSLEPHEAWSVPEHPSGASQGLEQP